MRLFGLPSPPTSPRPTKSAIRRMSVCSDSSSGSAAFFRSNESDAKPKDIPTARPQDKEHMLASLSHWSPTTSYLGECSKARFQSMFRNMGFKSRASMIPETPLSPLDRFLDSSLESWATAPSPLLPCASELSGSWHSTLMPPYQYPLMSPWEDSRGISVESLVENLEESSAADPLESSISSEFDNDKAVLQWAVRVPVSHSYIREILLSNGETFYKTLD